MSFLDNMKEIEKRRKEEERHKEQIDALEKQRHAVEEQTERLRELKENEEDGERERRREREEEALDRSLEEAARGARLSREGRMCLEKALKLEPALLGILCKEASRTAEVIERQHIEQDIEDIEQDIERALRLAMERRKISYDLLKYNGFGNRAADIISRLEGEGFIRKPGGGGRWELDIEKIREYLTAGRNT